MLLVLSLQLRSRKTTITGVQDGEIPGAAARKETPSNYVGRDAKMLWGIARYKVKKDLKQRGVILAKGGVFTEIIGAARAQMMARKKMVSFLR
jgi:hypothetical protein